jgi:superfamily I DNA/RNA helicase
LMVVGDDAQSIFGWRGASFDNIYQFQETLPGGAGLSA